MTEETKAILGGWKLVRSGQFHGEDKTWTRGPWTPCFGPVRGPLITHLVHGNIFWFPHSKNEEIKEGEMNDDITQINGIKQ